MKFPSEGLIFGISRSGCLFGPVGRGTSSARSTSIGSWRSRLQEDFAGWGHAGGVDAGLDHVAFGRVGDNILRKPGRVQLDEVTGWAELAQHSGGHETFGTIRCVPQHGVAGRESGAGVDRSSRHPQ